MGKEYLKLAEILNSLGIKYDLLDLTEYLADLLFIKDEQKVLFKEKSLFTQYEPVAEPVIRSS